MFTTDRSRLKLERASAGDLRAFHQNEAERHDRAAAQHRDRIVYFSERMAAIDVELGLAVAFTSDVAEAA